MCAADIIISVMELAISLFRMLSKYALKRTNYNMFSEKLYGSYN